MLLEKNLAISLLYNLEKKDKLLPLIQLSSIIMTSKEKTFIQINEGDVGMTIVTGQKRDETRTE